ncbi:MAG: prefoldin subunit [Candidatus Woesearchaeota archaeon]
MTTDDQNQKIEQLQNIEQGIQTLNAQKQQLSSRILEIDSALNELKNTDDSYKIIGNVMVKAKASSLSKELSDKRKHTEIRINAIEKQESSLKQKAQTIQKEVMENMQKNEKSKGE